MNFREELRLHIKAGTPAIYVETSEWDRFREELKLACKSLQKDKEPNFWVPGDHDNEIVDLIETIKQNEDAGGITVIEYIDRYVDGNGGEKDVPIMLSIIVRKLREIGHQIICVSPILNLPKILEKDFAVLSMPLPGRDDIKDILRKIAKDFNVDIDSANKILDAAKGLSVTEVYNAFAKVAVDRNKITAEEISLIVSEKEQIIRKSGHLQFIRTETNLDAIGGLENLKKWLGIRRNSFGQEGKYKNLDKPKGVLLLGIPGTGKSLSAKAVAGLWNMPLLRLDIGSIFGGLVGESEANIRAVIKTAESMEPCVLWVDEIEKGFSGNSGERDGGTSARVFGSFLTWMQEKEKEVFVFATANDISKLPPEFLRKGRFDEIFFVDLPGRDVRKDIFKIFLAKKGQKDIEPSDELLKYTDGYSGSEIESIVNEALHRAIEDSSNEEVIISASHLLDAAKETFPLSKTMDDKIKELRKWTKDRCRMASDSQPEDVSG